jgi:geranyl-CoA carboxylase alpha subunit
VSAKPFTTVLVANRGEIACRVMHTARSMGYRTVAVFSDADADAPHVELADRAVNIGPASASESYLRVDKIIEACGKAGADAIHPGYGFLSENSELVAACEAAGIVFIGPPTSAMEAMGKKREAKDLMRDAGVPVVPGTEGKVASDDELVGAAKQIGAPIMVKASAGGGGRGMRLVMDLANIKEEIERARSESLSAFGDGELILEKAVLDARHVEIQVIADSHGNCVHLGERDCSVQRRHQKVLEESPSPAVDENLRAEMGAAAVRAAKAIGYVGAGTVEFLLAPNGEFYFMEMNTRLQVEHPVTELVTGLDLVELQLEVASGKELPLEQDDVELNGHALEARLYAEDAWGGFLPQTGKVLTWRPAERAQVRVDGGVREGQLITPHYDAMVAKIISWGADRDEAIRQMLGALDHTRLHGVVHNQEFLHAAVTHTKFRAGDVNTKFVENELETLLAERPPMPHGMTALASALLARGADGAASWRSTGPAVVPLAVVARGERRKVRVAFDGESAHVTDGDSESTVGVHGFDDGVVTFTWDDVRQRAYASFDGAKLHLQIGAIVETFERVSLSERAGDEGASGDSVAAPMAGLLVEVRVEPGAKVDRGETVAVLEAMKMQLQLKAPRDGEVAEVRAAAGTQVDAKAVLVTLAPKEG